MSRRLVAVLHTSEYRGDHSADVQVAYDVNPNEAVGALWERIRADRKHPTDVRLDPTDHVVLMETR